MEMSSCICNQDGAADRSLISKRRRKPRALGQFKPRLRLGKGKCRKPGKSGIPPSKRLENAFLTLWTALEGPPLEREAKLIPNRKYRVDFYDPVTRIAYEIEGGVFCGGRHTRGIGFVKDCEKYNLHLMAGIRVYRIPGPLITKQYVEWLIQAQKHSEDSHNNMVGME